MMSIKPVERLELTLAIETAMAALEETTKQLRLAHRRISALDTQMRREGWTEADLDEIQPSVHQ
jgi:hypothetical protein